MLEYVDETRARRDPGYGRRRRRQGAPTVGPERWNPGKATRRLLVLSRSLP